MGVNIDFLLYQSEIIPEGFRWLKLLKSFAWKTLVFTFGFLWWKQTCQWNCMLPFIISCAAHRAFSQALCHLSHINTSTSVTFSLFYKWAKEAMGGNELLRVKKISVEWQSQDQTKVLSFPSQCFFQCFAFRSGGVGWVVGRSRWTSILPSSFLSISFLVFLSIHIPQDAVKRH